VHQHRGRELGETATLVWTGDEAPTCTVSPTSPPSVERSLESGQASPRGGPEDTAIGAPKAAPETPTVPRSG